MHPWIVRNMLFPFAKSVKGKSILPKLKELKKTQWLSQEDIKSLQFHKLKRILSSAYENVPFYHKRFREAGVTPDDIREISDLLHIPILTKQDVRNNLDGLLAQNCKRSTLIKGRTGGSTGEPLEFYTDKDAASSCEAARYLGLSWWGIDIGDREVMLWGSPIDISRYTAMHSLIKRLMNHIMLPAFDLTEARMAEYARAIEKFRPDYMYSIASSLHVFADFLKRNRIQALDWQLKAVVSTTETLFEYERVLAEEVFGCKVVDEYGSREGGMIAYHCPHGGLHVFAQNVLLEYVRDGQHVLHGDLGEIIVTRLDSYAMPLIRYQIGDVGIPSDKICSCGRGLPLMEELEGRVNDMIVTPEGKYLTGSFFPHLFKEFEGIQEYQIIQESKTSLLIRIVKNSQFSQDILPEIEQKMKYFVSENMHVHFDVVKSIPRASSNKRRFVIAEIPIELAQRVKTDICK